MTNKRLILALVLLALIVLTAALTTWDLHRGLAELDAVLTELKGLTPQEQELLVARSHALLELWNKAEGRFVLYVNHATLDHITQIVAELPALAAYGEYSHLYSHLDAITALLDDLWQSSLPTYRTLL